MDLENDASVPFSSFPLTHTYINKQLTYCGRRFGVVNNKAQYAKPENLESLTDWEKPGGHAERHRCIVALVKNKADPNLLDFQVGSYTGS